MKTALITGFEAFGRYMINPAKWLVLSADGKEIAGYRIYSLILPNIMGLSDNIENPGITVIKLAREIKSDVIISFGLGPHVHGFRIERTATNWIDNKKYCLPGENNHPLDQDQPPKERRAIDMIHWDLPKMKELFGQAAIPFDTDISDDAGLYSCNGIMYRVLFAMQMERIKIPYLFVHISCTEEAVELIPDFDRATKTIIKKEDTVKALEIILQSLVV